MLNAVVEVEFSQVKGVLVIFLRHSHSKVGHKQADAWRGVEGSIDLAWKLLKSSCGRMSGQKRKKKNITIDEI